MTSKVKRRAPRRRFLTCRVMDFCSWASKFTAGRKGSEPPAGAQSRIGETPCSMLRRSPIAMSPRGTNATRIGAARPSPRCGRRTASARGAREAREYGVLGRRLPGSHERHVGHDGARFRAARNARRLSDVVTFRWEMLPADSETVLESGLEFLIVDDEGRILIDHQFVPA